MELLKKALSSGASLAARKNGEVLTFSESGLRPLVGLIKSRPEFLFGADAADKVVGKAAALLFVYAGVKEVFASVISESAVAVFSENDTSFSYSRLVPEIRNRTNTGRCPMEEKALAIRTPKEAFDIFVGG